MRNLTITSVWSQPLLEVKHPLLGLFHQVFHIGGHIDAKSLGQYYSILRTLSDPLDLVGGEAVYFKSEEARTAPFAVIMALVVSTISISSNVKLF